MKSNAMFMAPMTTSSSNPDLTVSEAELRYYRARAKNVDYVITACTFMQRNQQGFAYQFYAGSDEYLASLRSLADAIHAGGAQAILQMQSPGRMMTPDLQLNPDMEIVSASAVRPERDGYKTPRALTKQEIQAIVASYHDVTTRAIHAGFDGVEIHGANTYLLQQFVSPLTNIRTDEYGQDRLLFSKEVVQAVLSAKDSAAKPEFMVGYRFSPEEHEDGGLRLSHTAELLDFLCTTGISYLHASLERFDRTSYFDDTVIATTLLGFIGKRKPLLGVGKIITPADVLRAFALGFDDVAIGTALLLNPDWRATKELRTQITEDSIPTDIPANMRKLLLKAFAKT